MIYLYAITEPAVEPPDCPGLDDAPLAVLECAEVGGLYSQHECASFSLVPETLWRHDQVVEAAMSRGPVLPARFGTTFDGSDAMAAALGCDQSKLRRQLERLRGCVELAVRISLPARTDSSPRDGLRYMETRLARRQERAAAVEQTLVPLKTYALGSRTTRVASDGGDLTASYLVRVCEVECFADRVSALARAQPELSLSCTGPWPPYSFVEDER